MIEKSINGPLSMATLDSQRVNVICLRKSQGSQGLNRIEVSCAKCHKGSQWSYWHRTGSVEPSSSLLLKWWVQMDETNRPREHGLSQHETSFSSFQAPLVCDWVYNSLQQFTTVYNSLQHAVLRICKHRVWTRACHMPGQMSKVHRSPVES